MKIKSQILAFLALAGCFNGVLGRMGPLYEVEELAVYYKKEVINGKTFVYREDLANGVKKEAWTINGQPVEADEYEEALLDEQKEVLRQKWRAEEQERQSRQEARGTMALDLHKKLLRLLIEQVESQLKKFDDHRLTPFVLFNETTFTQESFESIDQVLLQDAKRLLYNAQIGIDMNEFKGMINKLEELPTRLRALFHATVNNAIKRCDDTKILKGLLGVLSAD